jgi:2-amino-4-hydroxy-6-hydroxymethyldihydropteridine diphosphokinase
MSLGRKVLVGVGSNLGDRLEHLTQAYIRIQKHPKIEFIKSASIYSSKAIGFEGEDFYNTVWYLKVDISPNELLQELKIIEGELGRIQRKIGEGFRNRPIDLDILFYEKEELETISLNIPHREFYNRPYTVNPVKELMGTEALQGLEISKLEYLEGAKIEKDVTQNFNNRIDTLRNNGK